MYSFIILLVENIAICSMFFLCEKITALYASAGNADPAARLFSAVRIFAHLKIEPYGKFISAYWRWGLKEPDPFYFIRLFFRR